MSEAVAVYRDDDGEWKVCFYDSRRVWRFMTLATRREARAVAKAIREALK